MLINGTAIYLLNKQIGQKNHNYS
ncbi:hypothetical protein OIU78_019654 [Salix suchowensis]|nr:hypothetical protein OIU78_019654 [Salix suchowensis]